MNNSNLFVIFSAHFAPHIGGIEAFTEGLANALINDGQRVVIVTNKLNKHSKSVEISKNLTIIRLPCFALFNGRLPVPIVCPTFINLWKHEVGKLSPAGVLINARFYPHTILGIQYAISKNIPAIVLDHGSNYLSFGNAFLDKLVIVYEHLITLILKKMKARFYGISIASVEWLKTFKIEAEGIIGNAIDAKGFLQNSSERDFRKEFNIGANELLISFAGRLVPEKGIIELIDAINELSDLPVSLIIAGDGPLMDYVRSKESNRIRYVGRIDAADISSLYQQCDLMCLPSRSEGFCSAVLEASVCGTPSLITRVGIVDRLIEDGKTGFILPGVDVASIANGIRRAYNQRDGLRIIGEFCKEKAVKEFSWSGTLASFYRACGVSQ